MLKQWIPAVKPEKEELEKRLNAAQEELGRLQMQIKEHKLPVLVLSKAGVRPVRAHYRRNY